MKNLLDINLSDFISQSLAMGVVPIFKFVDKEKIEVFEEEKRSINPADETPIDVLEKQIRLHKRFINVIKNKEGADVPDSTVEEKLLLLIVKLESKIAEFENAIYFLNAKP